MWARAEVKYSIKRQFALIFIGLMAGTLLLCWFMNNIFLERYYISSKIEVIHEAYYSIRAAANSDTYSTEEFHRELNNVCSVYNIKVYVMDANSLVKYASVNGGTELEKRLMSYLFGLCWDAIKVVEEGEDFVLQRVQTEEGDNLEMYGRLSSGISFIMSTPVQSIRESVKIANRFLAYMGIVATMAGGIIIWFVAGKITKPILELNRISEKMVHLDFEAKYVESAHNEIDLLGKNINNLSASLERSISELKTANNELQKDIEKKERIDEMRKDFLANVSHELKTPIALIQGYAEGLSEGVNDDPESRNFYCEVIMDEAAKMNNIVQKLMTLNQLEFGNDVVTMERFDLAALARNHIQSAEILTRQNGIQVCMENYAPVYVWGDEFKAEEVFSNYFSNAVNHCREVECPAREGAGISSPAGREKKIIISLEQAGGKVRLGVFNTGDPIPGDAIPHLWEKFYKVDKARTREYGGSGVGLSIVKAIMKSMNQRYGVQNYTNGVLFWFELDESRVVRDSGDDRED